MSETEYRIVDTTITSSRVGSEFVFSRIEVMSFVDLESSECMVLSSSLSN